MQPPDELMVDIFLPAMRHLLASKLRSEGFSQNAISRMLGVTQASVSLYLSSGESKAYGSLSELSVGASDADGYAALLAEAVTEIGKGAIRGSPQEIEATEKTQSAIITQG